MPFRQARPGAPQNRMTALVTGSLHYWWMVDRGARPHQSPSARSDGMRDVAGNGRIRPSAALLTKRPPAWRPHRSAVRENMTTLPASGGLSGDGGS